MAAEMVKIVHFDWMAQIYFPKVEWVNRALTIDLDCVMRVGQIFKGWRGFGFAILGFGFGICWPVTEDAKRLAQQEHFWMPITGASQ